MKKIVFFLAIGILFSLDLFATNSESKTLKINACAITRVAFIHELTDGFKEKYKKEISLNKKGGVLGAVKALSTNTAEIGVGNRALFQTGVEKNMSYIQIAWGALAFIVHKDNPIKNITTQQVRDIITGKIKNWKELGGKSKKINFYSRAAGNRTGIGHSARKIMLGDIDKKFFQDIKANLRDTSGQIRKAVMKDKYGFGIDDVMSSNHFKELKILNIDGVTPTKEHILKHKYLAYRPYYLYFPEKITPMAKKFRDFALSNDGQIIISKTGTANLDEGLEHIDEGTSHGDHIINLKKDDTICDKDKKHLKAIGCGIIRVAFLKELNEAFGKKYCTTVSSNKSGGDIKVIKEVHEKKADVAIGCRPLFKSGIEKKMTNIQVAWGALAFIVHKDNPLNDISLAHAKDVLTGKIKNWKELGGEDKAIKLYVRKGKKSGVGASAREKLFENFKQDFEKSATRLKSSSFIRDAVVKDKDSFAIDDVTSSHRVKGLKILTVGGIEPTKANILAKKYTLSKAFYIFLEEKPTGIVKKYVDFALSKEGQAIIAKTGTANLEEASGKHDDMNLIFQKLKLNIKTR